MKPADAAGKILDRVMKLKTYVIELELPEEFEFTGAVPYDLSIKDGIIKIKVPALSKQEAEYKANTFVNER